MEQIAQILEKGNRCELKVEDNEIVLIEIKRKRFVPSELNHEARRVKRYEAYQKRKADEAKRKNRGNRKTK